MESEKNTGLDSDIYYTISNSPTYELKIKGSRFIGNAKSISSKEEALEFLESIRTKYYDATHNCFAYRIGNQGMIYRSGDDGEPSGTAGKPILFAIQKAGLSDIIVTVTRYFGGVKLGIGGLARAYSQTANELLLLATRKEVYRTQLVKVFCTYEDFHFVKKVLEDLSVNYKINYSDAIEIRAEVFVSKIDIFTELITSLTNGRAGTILI